MAALVSSIRRNRTREGAGTEVACKTLRSPETGSRRNHAAVYVGPRWKLKFSWVLPLSCFLVRLPEIVPAFARRVDEANERRVLFDSLDCHREVGKLLFAGELRELLVRDKPKWLGCRCRFIHAQKVPVGAPRLFELDQAGGNRANSVVSLPLHPGRADGRRAVRRWKQDSTGTS